MTEQKAITTNAYNIKRSEDISSFYMDNMSWPWANALRLYKNYFMYNMDTYARLYKNKEERRSCVISWITHTVQNASFNMLLESNTSVNIIRKTKESDNDESITLMKNFLQEVVDIFIPYQEAKEWYLDNMYSTMFDAMLLWYSHCHIDRIKVGSLWEKRNNKWVSMSIDTTEIYPSREYNNPFDSFYFGTWSLATWNNIFVKRKIVLRSVVKELCKRHNVARKEEWNKEIFSLSPIDYDAVKARMAHYAYSNLNVWTSGRSSSVWSFSEKFYFNRNSWHSDIVGDLAYSLQEWSNRVEITMVYWPTHIDYRLGRYFLYSKTRPIPYQGSLQSTARFKIIPWTHMGMWLWHVAQPIQIAFDKILNPRLDTVVMQASPAFLQRTWWGLFGDQKQYRVKPWAIYNVNEPEGQIVQMPMPMMGSSPYEELNVQFQSLNGMTGINPMSMWSQSKVERVSWSVQMQKASTENAMSPIIQSIEKTRWEQLKKSLIFAKVYRDEKMVDKVFWKNSAFAQIDLEDIVSDCSFIFTMRNEALESKANNVATLTQLMKTNAELSASGTDTWISTEKIAKMLIEKISWAFGDLSAETIMQASTNPEFVDDMVWQIPNTTWASGPREIEKAVRRAQTSWEWTVPPEMTTNSEWIN